MSTDTVPVPCLSASRMQVSIASQATAWPSFFWASHTSAASNRVGSFLIIALGTHPPAFDPKSSSRWMALMALWVRMPCRVAAEASFAA